MWSALSAFRWNNEAKEGSWLLAAVNCDGSPYILCLWKGLCSPFHFNPFSQLTSSRYRSPFQIQSLRCTWSVAVVIVVRFPLSNETLCTFVCTWASLLVQALQWAEVEGGPKSPLLCDLWYFANRFTFLKVFKPNCIGHENDILGQGVDQVVQAERVWQLCPLCGKLLQIHTPRSAPSLQVVVLAMVRQLGVAPKYHRRWEPEIARERAR